MIRAWGRAGLLTGALLGSLAASAADGPPTAAPTAAPACDSEAGCVPALTPVEIAIDADLGSLTSHADDRFPIHLAAPIVVNGVERVPAGAVGEGEIIHAKKAGGGGAPGELVIAARWLAIGDRHLRLRSLDLTGAGVDRIRSTNTTATAAGVVFTPAVFVGFMMKGGEKLVARGTVAAAKTAEDFMLAWP